MTRFTNIVQKHQIRDRKLGNKLQEHVKLFHTDLVNFVKAEVEEAKKMMFMEEEAPVITPEVVEDSGVPVDAPVA